MKPVPYHHNLKALSGKLMMEKLTGYQEAMKSMYDHVAQMTMFNPDKRYIDAVEILERISATSDEITKLLQAEQLELTVMKNALDNNH